MSKGTPCDRTGRVVAITRATTGIGQAIALAPAAAGTDVVPNGRPPATETTDKAGAPGWRARIVSAGLSAIARVAGIVPSSVSDYSNGLILTLDGGRLAR
jgi:2-dehydro-3-deoxy-D-gluconate 5-dehydrogenase